MVKVRRLFFFFLIQFFIFTLPSFSAEFYIPFKYPGSLGFFRLDSKVPSRLVLGYKGKRWVFRSAYGSDLIYFVIPYQVRGKFSLSLYEGKRKVFFGTFETWKKRYRVSRIWVKERPLKGELLKKIISENRLLRRILRETTRRKFKERRLYPPLRKLSISTPFGARRIINGKKRSVHWGTDFRAPKGAPVFASLSGKVVLARRLYFTGNTVIIDHGLGIHTLYAHLSKILVREGQFVKAGQVIGKVGSTGRSTGPHLHFGFYVEGVKADPMLVMKEDLY